MPTGPSRRLGRRGSSSTTTASPRAIWCLSCPPFPSISRSGADCTAARKTMTYAYDDASKWAVALDKLSRASQTPTWVHVTDAAASKILRPASAADPFTVQVSVGGTATGMAAKEKAIDASMAGFTSKNTEVPNPFDVPAAAYRKAADTVTRSLFVGEVRLPAKSVGDFVAKTRAFGDQNAAKAGIYASLRATGTVSTFPFFSAPKDRSKVYDLSKGVRAIAAKTPGAAFTSRLAHLWEEEAHFMRRMAFLRSLKLTIDTAHVAQPLVSP